MAKRPKQTEAQKAAAAEEVKGLNALQKAKLQVRKQFGAGTSMEGSSAAVVYVSTGNVKVDCALGGGCFDGGIPLGRHIEVFGPESVGKTTWVLGVCAAFQKAFPDKAILYLDYENTFDPAWAELQGVDLNPDRFVLEQPSTFEEGVTIAEIHLKNKSVSAVVTDTLAAMMPESQGEEKLVGRSAPGGHSRTTSDTLRRITSTLNESDADWFWINQIRNRIGVMFGNPETTTGGKSLRFYASLRIEIRVVGGEKKVVKDSVTGDDVTVMDPIRVRFSVVKNKVATPFHRVEYNLTRGQGIDNLWSLAELLIHWGQVKATSNGFYSFTKGLIDSAGLKGLSPDKSYREPEFRAALLERKDIVEKAIKEDKVRSNLEIKLMGTSDLAIDMDKATSDEVDSASVKGGDDGTITFSGEGEGEQS